MELEQRKEILIELLEAYGCDESSWSKTVAFLAVFYNTTPEQILEIWESRES